LCSIENRNNLIGIETVTIAHGTCTRTTLS
jgi:hypothetical protein